MTATEMAALVGRHGTIEGLRKPGDLAFAVVVLNVQSKFGVTRYQVRPVSGSGTAWVQSITLTDEAAS